MLTSSSRALRWPWPFLRPTQVSLDGSGGKSIGLQYQQMTSMELVWMRCGTCKG